ncbi:hypothetical protein APX70_200607 [Pseudomonas syringae pv. maculicola]|uniref:Uncharacterized protein n=1 Tax=Pseudomonas syringae pv. maculicola TaxID=59511 RepID=A0A3M2U0T1_PSEYM|nr:hypothetical protein APX70_200607 [Pseudomonas syringae pv. maculicola]
MASDESIAIAGHPQASFQGTPCAINCKTEHREKAQQQNHQFQHVVTLSPGC